MPNPFFQFKQFTIHHDRCAMKVTTDACLFGAWTAAEIQASKTKVLNLLDVGTGTGLLSLMVRQKNELTIDAIEIDAQAAMQAQENICTTRWKDDIRVKHEDLLHWQPDKKWDCIISNPPFYENELKGDNIEKKMAHHDESLRLKDLLLFVKGHLVDNGIFFLLLPAKREAEAEALLRQFNFHIHEMVRVKQTENHGSFRLLLKAGFNHQLLAQSELIIKEGGHYSPAFYALLKQYYLHL